MTITSLTIDQKMKAFELKFYQFLNWMPKAGDHYTTTRADLELYQIVKIENDMVFTERCASPGLLNEWPEAKFLHEGFGPCRMWIPSWLLK